MEVPLNEEEHCGPLKVRWGRIRGTGSFRAKRGAGTGTIKVQVAIRDGLASDRDRFILLVWPENISGFPRRSVPGETLPPCCHHDLEPR